MTDDGPTIRALVERYLENNRGASIPAVWGEFCSDPDPSTGWRARVSSDRGPPARQPRPELKKGFKYLARAGFWKDRNPTAHESRNGETGTLIVSPPPKKKTPVVSSGATGRSEWELSGGLA
jgi:hypothetical protein